jgi:hypothetical protein
VSRRLERDILAIPLTSDEAQVLVTAMRAEERVMRNDFWAHSGSGWAVSMLSAVLRDAGIAAALGHPYIPVLAQEVAMLENSLVLMRMHGRPCPPIADSFEELLSKMHLLAGMASVKRWRVKWLGDGFAGGYSWVQVPDRPVGSHSGAAELTS